MPRTGLGGSNAEGRRGATIGEGSSRKPVGPAHHRGLGKRATPVRRPAAASVPDQCADTVTETDPARTSFDRSTPGAGSKPPRRRVRAHRLGPSVPACARCDRCLGTIRTAGLTERRGSVPTRAPVRRVMPCTRSFPPGSDEQKRSSAGEQGGRGPRHRDAVMRSPACGAPPRLSLASPE